MKDFKKIRKHRRLYRTGRWASRKFGWLIRAVRWLAHKLRFLRIFRFLNPFRYIRKLDWYIIKKFLGYYFFSIALIISIAIVFDFNENLSKFTEHHAPARAIIFDYYANFVPYLPTSSVRCSCSWRSFSSPASWQAIPKSSPSWRREYPSSVSSAHT